MVGVTMYILSISSVSEVMMVHFCIKEHFCFKNALCENVFYLKEIDSYCLNFETESDLFDVFSTGITKRIKYVVLVHIKIFSTPINILKKYI